MKKRVLFVDDEPRVLEGLRNRLRRQRDQWEMQFVTSGAQALAAMDNSAFDVIVSDLRMPGMDGVTLLQRIRERNPKVVRIILSGQADSQATLLALPVAHRFLAKPCEAGVLEEAVERSCAVRELVTDEAVLGIVGGIERLPSVPRVYFQLLQALARENATAKDVAQILAQDPAMCAKILQIVNSAFFRLSREVTRIEDAVAYLGFVSIKQLVLAVEVFKGGDGGMAESLERLQQHAMLVGRIAAGMLTDRRRKDDAFTAGLLHDIGKLLLLMNLPSQTEQVTAELRTCDEPMYAVEQRIFGVTHAEIGACLLGIWGVPDPIVEVVAYHHTPEQVPQTGDLLAAVHIANILVDERITPTFAGQVSGVPQFDDTQLANIALADSMETWRDIASKEIERVTGIASK